MPAGSPSSAQPFGHEIRLKITALLNMETIISLAVNKRKFCPDESLREVIPKKKRLPRFGHLWGNYRLSRLRKKNIPPKIPQNNLKIPEKYLKTTPKLLKWVQPPPPFY